MAGATLHYEPSLRGEIDAFVAAYRRFLDGEAAMTKQAETMAKSADALLADLNRLVGGKVDETRLERQRKILDDLLAARAKLRQARENATFCLVTRKTVKDHLRQGGSLPNFTYDKATDTASYHFELESSGEGKGVRLVIPVADAASVGQTADAVFGTLLASMRAHTGTAVQMVVDGAIRERLLPGDARYRWFTEGMAASCTIGLLNKHVGREAAAAYAVALDVRPVADLEREADLLAWLSEDVAIDAPLEREQRLAQARRAFAAHEAQRLLDAHGPDTLARILDKTEARPKNASADLLAAIRAVTGDDIAARLRRYRTFATDAEGRKKHAAAYDAAIRRKDLATVLYYHLRERELKEQYELLDYARAARLLARLGHEAAGDAVYGKQMALLARQGLDEPLLALKALFVEYALEGSKLGKAYGVAEDVLAKRPAHLPSLAARLERLANAGKLDDARDVARFILTIDRDPASPIARFAEQVLDAKPGEKKLASADRVMRGQRKSADTRRPRSRVAHHKQRVLVPTLEHRDGGDDAPASLGGVSAHFVPPRWSVVLPVPTLEHRDEYPLLPSPRLSCPHSLSSACPHFSWLRGLLRDPLFSASSAISA